MLASQSMEKEKRASRNSVQVLLKLTALLPKESATNSLPYRSTTLICQMDSHCKTVHVIGPIRDLLNPTSYKYELCNSVKAGPNINQDLG
ncbi:hypothetical protein TNCV_2700821 [Trichonephila clavipes]|nr:hypothetical protein TNCV_2700821 [Trichonephila clavipes]